MKHSILLPILLVLSACSTNSQLNVVDDLTLVAANDGVFMNPSRWIVTGHPVQTTYVSLNGQLGLQVGQVCIASRFRSPFTNNCKVKDENSSGQFYSEYYKADNNDLTAFLNTAYDTREAQIDYVNKSTVYYACVAQKTVENSNNKELESDAVDKTKQQLSLICSDERKQQQEALATLKTKQLAEQKQIMKPNRLVYNWAEALKFESGAVVLKQSNNASSGNYNKEASGYTVVNGLLLERYKVECSEIKSLMMEQEDSARLKIVTMTLSADELYYDARENKAAAFNVNLTFSSNELEALNDIFDSDIEASINTAIASSSNIASRGYLKNPNINISKDLTANKGLTYYAVLTDLESFQCPEN